MANAGTMLVADGVAGADCASCRLRMLAKESFPFPAAGLASPAGLRAESAPVAALALALRFAMNSAAFASPAWTGLLRGKPG